MATKLRIGTGGLPLTSEGGTIGGLERLRQLGLEHLELEFVQSVFLKEDTAAEVAAAAEKNDITLSVHGSYFVNLASPEKAKWHAGIQRVVQAARIGAIAGAKSVTYHSGFIQGDLPGATERVAEGTREILEQVKAKQAEINIAPELTGKASQFGDREQLIQLVKKMREEGFDNMALCIDFAHQYARHLGQFNTYDEFAYTIEDISKHLGERTIHNLHMHVSAIEFGDKGEKNHLLLARSLAEYADYGVGVEGIEEHFKKLDAKRLGENKFDWKALLKALKATGVGGYLVCESPILELDAVLLQKYYQNL